VFILLFLFLFVVTVIGLGEVLLVILNCNDCCCLFFY